MTISKQTQAVYERLRQGPATEPELRAYARSKRIAARVFDLNASFRERGILRRVKGNFVNSSKLYQYRIVRTVQAKGKP